MPITQSVDVVVLGQGLAGTALAWSLLWEGARVVVIDREARVGSSGIAAGLVTPVTGQKLTLSWRFADFWPHAIAFYRRVESEVHRPLFREDRMVRLFADERERRAFNLRGESGELDGVVSDSSPQCEPSLDQTHGGFEMTSAGRLDVLLYLDSSRESLLQRGSFLPGDVDVSRDFELEPSGVTLPRFGIRSRRLVFCQGYQADPNPWFRDVQFKPAKGEILTVRIPGLTEQKIVHRGIWLAPMGDQVFKVGATYDWSHLDSIPTSEGRTEILTRLAGFLNRPVEVLEHAAAVRPIHRNQYPVVGIHPVQSQLGIFNGFGSKGVLQAPYFASQFAGVLRGQGEVDADVELNRKTTWSDVATARAAISFEAARHVKPRPSRPLTEQAQLAVGEVIQSGDVVIDATTGNGYDTHFLAEQVGQDGRVYAFDIQQVALDRTQARLMEAGLENVTLLNQSHANMTSLIPSAVHGHVAAIMFNLGYLPSGDKTLTTQPESTRQAIGQAATLLRRGGVMTIVAYMGHDGGNAEADIVQLTLGGLGPGEFETKAFDSQPGKKIGPRLFLVKRVV
ncbi:FAD-dependent oxidoreductase [Schlesneria paludicola]|uniref:FAD-dependent oxidoreductase n=1 Tax=Schlesneria paludicola TaxID=360056 RepID=UPI00029A45F5|nr:FAD-dependent oxidoreductase [Schlesneria paludicola]